MPAASALFATVPAVDAPTFQDADAPGAGPHPLRPTLVAYPIFGFLVFLSLQIQAPLGTARTAIEWLIIAIAGATEPTVTFGLAVGLSARFPLFARPSRSLAIHIAASLGAAILAVVVRTLMVRNGVYMRPASTWEIAMPTLVAYFIFGLAAQGARAARYAKQAEAARQRLREELEHVRRDRAEAELRALKAELNPHFLGNALQGVKALLRTDAVAADRILGQLGDLLRSTLVRAGTQETSLRGELDSLDPFLEVERARLGGRLDLEFDIDPAVADARVPDMILQPLVENAVKHGLIPIGGGAVRVRAKAVNGASERLEIVVEDNGVALGTIGTTRSSEGGGVGLANIRARLRELYGGDASLELFRGGIGTIVRVTLPLQGDDVEARAPEGLVDAPHALSRDRMVRYIGSALRIGVSVVAWLYWARNNAVGNVMSAAMKGVEGKELYSMVDACVVASVLLVLAHGTFWVARRWPVVARESEARFTALRAAGGLLAVITTGVVAMCVIKYVMAVAFDYTILIEPAHLKHNIVVTIVGVSSLCIGTAFVAQCYYPLQTMVSGRLNRHRLNVELAATSRRRVEAELRALKAELNPHFIGNALNAVSVLMHSDVAAATNVLDQLTDLLRVAVDGGRTHEVTLREELAALEPFLCVERIRLGSGLKVNVEVDDQVLNGRVPHLILQPLVENAVKHGFADRISGGQIDVSARRSSTWLEVSVRDDGTGLKPADTRRGATGLANTRARLSQLYGDDASLELAAGGAGGTVATIKIPWREEPAAQPRV